MKKVVNATMMRGRFSALRQWVVLVQNKRNGPWLVIPPIAPFMLLVRSSAPEHPWIDKIMQAVRDVKKESCVLVQKDIMVEALRPTALVPGLPESANLGGPRWETFCQFIRLRAAANNGLHAVVRLLAPGGLVAAEHISPVRRLRRPFPSPIYGHLP